MDNHPHESAGWLRLTILWIMSFMDQLFTADNLSRAASVLVIVLTGLQIWVTIRKIRRTPDTHFDKSTDWKGL